jgi:tRNA (guanine-N7-)-methyltransferase
MSKATNAKIRKRVMEMLKKEGEVIFKTDNRDLFDFSVEEAKLAGWELKEVTYDLHHSEFLAGNVMTEYEERFVTLGNPIHRMIISRGKRDNL